MILNIEKSKYLTECNVLKYLTYICPANCDFALVTFYRSNSVQSSHHLLFFFCSLLQVVSTKLVIYINIFFVKINSGHFF